MSAKLERVFSDISDEDYKILESAANQDSFSDDLYEENQERLPVSLFRYQTCTVENFEKLKNSVVQCSNPHYFDDGFDIGIRSEDLDKAIEAQGYARPRPLQNVMQTLQEQRENTRVACFTDLTPKDGAYLWQEFAGTHQGFCVEYDAAALYEKDKLLKTVRFIINKVVYTSELEKFFLYFCSAIQKSRKKGDIFQRQIFIDAKYARVKSLLKDMKYAPESEWRLVYWILEEGGVKWKHIPEDDMLPMKIKKIYLGKRISSEDEKALLQIAKAGGIAVE